MTSYNPILTIRFDRRTHQRLWVYHCSYCGRLSRWSTWQGALFFGLAHLRTHASTHWQHPRVLQGAR